MEYKSTRRKALVIGNTSKFHLGSKTNYSEFIKLAKSKYDLNGEISYDFFGIEFMDFKTFTSILRESKWWEKAESSDVFLVHGEGLTEKHNAYTYHYLYFSWLAKKMKKESHLVNFSMYESDNYLNLLKNFDYIASRDILTKRHLQSRGIDSELAFDCCVLSSEFPGYTETDGHIALIRGRNWINEDLIKDISEKSRYNCSWDWETEDKIERHTFKDYTSKLNKARFSMTTSFHANIISYMSGIPFISLDTTNPKYLSLDLELLPAKLRDPNKLMDKSNRKLVYMHYKMILHDLIRRAQLNIK